MNNVAKRFLLNLILTTLDHIPNPIPKISVEFPV
jgi:uncharacterized membrane protein YqaE (UPF0057 family)